MSISDNNACGGVTDDFRGSGVAVYVDIDVSKCGSFAHNNYGWKYEPFVNTYLAHKGFGASAIGVDSIEWRSATKFRVKLARRFEEFHFSKSKAVEWKWRVHWQIQQRTFL